MNEDTSIVHIRRGSNEVVLDGDLDIVGRSSMGPRFGSSDRHKQTARPPQPPATP